MSISEEDKKQGVELRDGWACAACDKFIPKRDDFEPIKGELPHQIVCSMECGDELFLAE